MMLSRGNHKKEFKSNHGRLYHLSQILKLSYFKLPGLGDFLMHY